jgi:hypothetical protein
VQAGHEGRGGDGRQLVDDGLLHVPLDRLQHRGVRDRAEGPAARKCGKFKLEKWREFLIGPYKKCGENAKTYLWLCFLYNLL